MANTQEYGLMDLLSLGLLNPNQPAAAADSGLLQSGIIYDAAQHNADINALLGTFTQDFTDYQIEVQQSGGGRSQPIDEFGRALPVKPTVPYTVGLPIQGSGSALGLTYLTRNRITVRDLARSYAKLYRGDYRWVVDHVLGQLFASASYTYRDITGKGNLTIQPLANGDAVTYYRTTSGSTSVDTHQLAQAAAIADASNPFPTIRDELLEHPDNDGEVVAFISTSLVATTTALAEFNSATIDPDITLGTDTDRLTGSLNMTLPLGAVVKGKTDSGVWIVEWPQVPAGYIVAITTGGARPLGRRIFPEANLQGFRSAGEREDFPYFEDQWQRWEGYGAYNRTGAVVMRIGNASYAVPTNLDVPMP